MDTGIIKKVTVKSVMESLGRMGRVIAPVRQDDAFVFSSLPAGETPDLSYPNSKLSPKGCLFPQTEVLFFYDCQGEDHQVSPPKEESGITCLVGVRPCDARAMALIDPVFDDPQYKDTYYLQRRKNMVIIGLACAEPQSTCFCTSTGGSPFDTTGMDMLWQDLGDRYLVKAVTPRGQELLSGFGEIEKAEKKDLAEAQKQAEKTLSAMSPIFDTEKIGERLSSSFGDSLWQEIHEKCLGCAVCTFVCPTCHCFDIQDEKNHDRGRRVRLWDSCMFPLFTLHTSGHNPRSSGKERMRQRIMHKFNYFKTNNGQIACVGCGRCIKECPVNMDIRQIVSVYS
ncbi:MAG: 4Fe-4S dicluster domain-containing protein [bacterium]